MAKCNHKTSRDHIAGKMYVGPKLMSIWICSNCKNESVWTDKHSNFGLLECPRCDESTTEWVACSDECADKLNHKD